MPNATFGFEDETRGWPGHTLGSGQGMADAAFQLCQAHFLPTLPTLPSLVMPLPQTQMGWCLQNQSLASQIESTWLQMIGFARSCTKRQTDFSNFPFWIRFVLPPLFNSLTFKWVSVWKFDPEFWSRTNFFNKCLSSTETLIWPLQQVHQRNIYQKHYPIF